MFAFLHMWLLSCFVNTTLTATYLHVATSPMSQLHAGPALRADFQTACNDSAGQAEEPKLIASAAIGAPTHARSYSIHTRCIWLQPSEDLADDSYAQSIQCQRHNAAVWEAGQEPFSERSMGILRYMLVQSNCCIKLTGSYSIDNLALR